MPQSSPGLAFDPMYVALRELELTENEQRLYVASIARGPMSISKLATILGLPRPNLYKIIDGLVQKGLVDPRSRARYTKTFSVEPPHVISELLKRKRDEQSSIDRNFIERLPAYMSAFRQGDAPLKVKVLVGRKDFEDLYTQMYEEVEQEARFCGSLRGFVKAFGQDFFDQTVSKRLKKNIKGKALILESDRGYFPDEKHRADRREVRYLDGVDEFTPSFHVFSNKIVFWQPVVPMAVLIEDEYLVKMMSSLYEGMWGRASE